MRTENDLMAALRTLEPAAPDEAAVLRGSGDGSRAAGSCWPAA